MKTYSEKMRLQIRDCDLNAAWRPGALQQALQAGLQIGNDLILGDLRADVLCGKTVVASVQRMPFAAVAVCGTCRAQTAGVEQSAGEGVDKFRLVGTDRAGTVIAVFAHPAHVCSAVAALPDI